MSWYWGGSVLHDTEDGIPGSTYLINFPSSIIARSKFVAVTPNDATNRADLENRYDTVLGEEGGNFPELRLHESARDAAAAVRGGFDPPDRIACEVQRA